MEKQPSKPKDNLLTQIAKEAISRIEKKIAAINAIIEDRPLEHMDEIDQKIEDLLNKYKTVKKIKELEQIQNDIKKQQMARADLWRRFEKQKDITKLFDKRHKLENEKELYQKAMWHLHLIRL